MKTLRIIRQDAFEGGQQLIYGYLRQPCKERFFTRLFFCRGVIALEY